MRLVLRSRAKKTSPLPPSPRIGPILKSLIVKRLPTARSAFVSASLPDRYRSSQSFPEMDLVSWHAAKNYSIPVRPRRIVVWNYEMADGHLNPNVMYDQALLTSPLNPVPHPNPTSRRSARVIIASRPLRGSPGS